MLEQLMVLDQLVDQLDSLCSHLAHCTLLSRRNNHKLVLLVISLVYTRFSLLFLSYYISTTFNYHNSGHYPSSCLLFKTRRFGDWILSPFSAGTYSGGPNRKNYSLSPDTTNKTNGAYQDKLHIPAWPVIEIALLFLVQSPSVLMITVFA
jgi:hypothetical protein